MNRLNKYTIVPVEEEVLNGSSNEENEEDMININGLKPLHDFFSSSVDPKPAGENKRDIWQEIEYLAASNKQAVKNEESAKDGVSQNPDSSNFIFPFLNSENTRNSEFKRDYFSFDDDDFNLLVPDNSTFPSIDSSSSDDDDGGRFFYRPGRYRLDTIQEENEEDVDSSSVQEDSTDLEGPNAVIFNSSFAASNESEGSLGFINIDRKLSLEFLKERKKRLQEKHVRRLAEDSSTDEESGFQKTIFPTNSLTKRRLRSKRLLDMVPMSCSQTEPTARMQQKNNDQLNPPSSFSENFKPDGTNGPQSSAIKSEPLNSLTNNSIINKNSISFLNAGVNADESHEFKNKEFTEQKEPDKSSIQNVSQKQRLQSFNTISTSIKPRTALETKCSTLRETNPFINFERFDARKESHPNTSTDISTQTYQDHKNIVSKNNDQEQLRNANAKQAHDATDSQTFGSWSSINEFLQRSKFSLDLPDPTHQNVFPSKSKEFSNKSPTVFNEEKKALHQSTQTSQISSSDIVYRKYFPDSPQSTSSTQTQQSSQQTRAIEQKKQLLFATTSLKQPDNIDFNVNHKIQNVKFNISNIQSVDPRVELVKSKIANVKLKPPPSSIERQWDAIMHTNKPREIKIISKQNKKIQSEFSNKTQNANYSNSFHQNLNYEVSRDHSSRKFKLSSNCLPYKNMSNKDSTRRFKTFTEKEINQDKNVKSVVDLTRLGCREANLRSMSESELRVWLSLQKLDIPEWYLAYPDKNKEMADLKNTRSVNDIMADIEKLSIPGERRIIGDMNLTKSVPSLVLLQEQQQRSKVPPTTSSKRWSTHLPSPYQSINDTVNVSLPQHYRRLKWCLNDCDSECSRLNSKSLKHLKKEPKFTLPSDFLKTNLAEPPFQAVVMPPFEEIMKGIDIPISNETKGEILSEKLVKQTIAPDMDLSIESPHVIRIRRIRNPEEVQRDKELARMQLNDESATQSFDVAETHFPAESSGIIESYLPQKSDDYQSSTMSYLNIPQKADRISLPRSVRSSRSFVETDFLIGRRISQHHDDRPLRLCEEINPSVNKQNRPSEYSKSLPDDSGFGSDMTPMVSNHAKRDSILSNIHKFTKSPNWEPQPSKTISNPKKFFTSGKTILNPSKAPKERTKLSSFSFGFFRASKKASTSSQKMSTTQSNNINKLNHELQRGSFAPFIEHRV